MEQDKWQPSSKLTLDLGFEVGALSPRRRRSIPAAIPNYDPTTNTLVLAGIGGQPA